MKKGKSIQNESLLSKDDRKASQGFVDLKSKTIEQIDELIERQDKLLQNKFFIAKLPDKGEKIISFKATLDAELKKRREEYNSACNLLSNLTLNDTCSEELEWNDTKSNKLSEQLDSDDESDCEIDPLKLIASHSGTAKGKKTVNLSEINSNKTKTLYVDKFCEKYGQAAKPKERFKPNQLKNNDKNLFVESAVKVKERLGDKWEITEATPPVPVYKDTVIISLSESIKLQIEQAKKLKEIEMKNATERLLKGLSVKMGDKLPVNNISEYRMSKNAFDESVVDSEEEEVRDSEGEDNEKTVCFFVESSEH